ncbi:uncharacterized protein LOC143296500 isoform X2 [Babylonia areolata]|uniref:uncharacterized protein LOC143296500 isoform X2 n=1 Tax=Babylonia areolata TaxID=304850 RepID=UPI003FD2572F
MASLVSKKEPEAGGYPPTNSQVPVVEVVEMRGAAPGITQQDSDAAVYSSFGVKTDGTSSKFRAQFDKGERERKVSKYQKKKKAKPSSMASSEVTIKTERPWEQDAPTEQLTKSSTADISDSSVVKMYASGTEPESDGAQSMHDAGDPHCADNTPVSVDAPKEDDLLELSLMVGDGEFCSEQIPDVDEDALLLDESEDMKYGSQSPRAVSEGSASDGSACSEDEADREMRKSVMSSLNCQVKFTKSGPSMTAGNLEWKKMGDVWRLSSEDPPLSNRTSSFSPTSGFMSSSSSDGKKLPGKAQAKPVTTVQAPTKSVSASKPSSGSTGLNNVELSHTVAQGPHQKTNTDKANFGSGTTVSGSRSTTTTTVKGKGSTLSTAYGSSSQAGTQSSVKLLNTNPASVAAGARDNSTLEQPSKSDNKIPGKPILGHSEVKTTKTSSTVTYSPRKVETRDNIIIKKVFPSESEMGRFGPSSSSSLLLGQLDSSSMDKEMLPGIRSAGHLGLASHSGTDWDMEEMAVTKAEEEDEDFDVLSLYEFDTFLENEDEEEDRGHGGSTLSKRSTNKGGEGMHLMPEQNLSISVSDRSERRVSRPNSKDQSESQAAVQNDSPKKGVTGTDKEKKGSPQSDWTPRVQETAQQSGRTDTRRGSPGWNDDHKFQMPKFPALKSSKNDSAKPRPGKGGSLLGKPAHDAPRGRGDWKGGSYHQSLSLPRVRSVGGIRQAPRVQSLTTQRGPPSFERTPQNNRMKDMQKELETELKHFLEKKNILEATEVVGKMHRQQAMKVDRGLVLNLLHVLIREGAVPQLMKVFSFVCNQGVFNSEVCNAYIRLGCAEGDRYDRQLKNIFQYLRRHSVKPAGDCIISLLRLYSDHPEDPVMFWLMLTYFDAVPGFVVPVPLVQRAVERLLQHKEPAAVSRFNQWVLSTRSESVLGRLDLALVGRMVVSMLPAARSRLQKVIADTQEENEGEELKREFMAPVDTVLVLPTDFSQQDYVFCSRRIQDCGTQEDVEHLAEVYVELCGRPGHCRCLLKDFAAVLLHSKAVVAAVDRFLRRLYHVVQQERTQGAGAGAVDPDEMALAHLSALLLEHTCFTPHLQGETTLGLLDVLTQCPLVVKKLLLNCRDVGCLVVTACLKRQQPLRALELLKTIQFRKNDEQGTSLVKDLMRQLLALGDVEAAHSALRMAASREAMGPSDVGVLSSQLLWHSLHAGNVHAALDLLQLARTASSPSPSPSPCPPLLPVPLLRALLVASAWSGHEVKAAALFEELKQRGVYNAEPLGPSPPYTFQLSSMLTPPEVRFCLQDRLKELHQTLCRSMARGRQLSPLDRGLTVGVVGEHDPHLLSLPFLALAPRSRAQAVGVVVQALGSMSTPIHATFSPQADLLVVDPASLVTHLQASSPGLKQEVFGEDSPGTGRPVSIPPASSHPASKSQGFAGRPVSIPPAPSHPASKSQGFAGRPVSIPPAPSHPASKSQGFAGRPVSIPPASSHPASKSQGFAGRPGSLPPTATRPPATRPGPGQGQPAASRATLLPGDEMLQADVQPFPQLEDSSGRQFLVAQVTAQPAPRSVDGRLAVSPGDTRPPPPYPPASCGGPSDPPPQPPHALRARQMKRRLTAPPPESPAAVPHKPHRKALLPTPPLSLRVNQQAGTTTASPGELSEESPPKKMMKSSPPEPPSWRDRRAFADSDQDPHWRSSPSPGPPVSASSVMPRDRRQSQQSSRGGRVTQQQKQQPPTEYTAQGQFPRPSARVTEEKPLSCARNDGCSHPPQSYHRGSHASQQQGVVQRQQQFCGEERNSSVSWRVGQPQGGVGRREQLFYGEERSSSFSPPETGERFLQDAGRLLAQSAPSRQPPLTQQSTRGVRHQLLGERNESSRFTPGVSQHLGELGHLSQQSALPGHSRWQQSPQPNDAHTTQPGQQQLMGGGDGREFPAFVVEEQMVNSEEDMMMMMEEEEEGEGRDHGPWQGGGAGAGGRQRQQQQHSVQHLRPEPPQGDAYSRYDCAGRAQQASYSGPQKHINPLRHPGPFRGRPVGRVRGQVGRSARGRGVQLGRGGDQRGPLLNQRTGFGGSFAQNQPY